MKEIKSNQNLIVYAGIKMTEEPFSLQTSSLIHLIKPN